MVEIGEVEMFVLGRWLVLRVPRMLIFLRIAPRTAKLGLIG